MMDCRYIRLEKYFEKYRIPEDEYGEYLSNLRALFGRYPTSNKYDPFNRVWEDEVWSRLLQDLKKLDLNEFQWDYFYNNLEVKSSFYRDEEFLDYVVDIRVYLRVSFDVFDEFMALIGCFLA